MKNDSLLPSIPVKMEILSITEKAPEKPKLNFCRSALFHMETTVSIKYFLNGCRFIRFRAVLLAKLVILGVSSLSSFTLTLREALVTKLVISGISSSIFLILALYTYFLTTSFFTTSINLLKSTGRSNNLQHLIYLLCLYII